MSAIKVKVSELYEQVKLMKDDGMIYATLSILEQDPKYDVPTSLFNKVSKSKCCIFSKPFKSFRLLIASIYLVFGTSLLITPSIISSFD